MEKSEKPEDGRGKGTESIINGIARTKIEGDLPLDLIIEILSRIPGSTLFNFRCVCKLWYSLTRDRRLISLHFERASKANLPRIIIFSRGEGKNHQKYSLTLLDDTFKTKFSLTRDSDSILTTPPCNGLICLYDFHRNIKLCNPTTQEFLVLPKPTADRRGIANAFPKCSFGYHPLTKKYKVVRFFYRQLDHSTSTYVLGCEIYTLGSSDSWRYVGDINSYVTGAGINVNGSIYWTTGVTAKIPDEIIALDLESEKFRVISPPHVASYGVQVTESMFLVQLEGKLSLVHSRYGSMDIWMLCGENGMWMHESVHFKCGSGDQGWIPEPVLIHEGKILWRFGGFLYCHDLRGKPSKIKKVYGHKLVGSGAKFYAFVETLVPLRMLDF